MLEAEPFSCSAHGGLDFVGNKESSVFTAKFLSGGEVIVGGIFDSLSLDGFKDEGSDLAGFQFFLEIGKVAKLYEIGTREEGSERFAEIAGVGNGEGSKGKAVVGAFLGEDAGALGGGAGKFQGTFDGFGSGIAKEAGIAGRAEFFDESFGEEAGEDRAVHLHHVGEVEFKDVTNCFLYCGMITADVENAVAAEEVEVVLAVEVVEVSAFGPSINFIEPNGALNLDESTIDEFIVQVVVLPESGEDRVFEIERGHGLFDSGKQRYRKQGAIFRCFIIAHHVA